MPQTDPEKEAALDEMNETLQTGIRRENANGHSTEFDHDTISRERDRLETQLGKAPPTVFRFRRH